MLEPKQSEPTDWEHFDLWQRVREALYACPDHFTTPTNIEGLLATDIFTLNTPLAATIEESVVRTLNGMRSVWDPDREYLTYTFIRQPQTFPDVILRETNNGQDILMGIELKGWYLLAREGVPTYRLTVTEKACNPQDLIAVVPWVLSNILAGSPVLHRPFVETVRYCTQKRNHYWIYERKTAGNTDIEVSEHIGAYPLKSQHISDKAVSDNGGNFGRLARYGIMDDYIAAMHSAEIRGVSVSDWLTFFKNHAAKG